jgi:hypothetical protein
MLFVRRRDPRTAHLTRVRLDPLGSDLPSMVIKSHYDHPTGALLERHGSQTCADLPRLR